MVTMPAEALGGARRVHRGVAAADDDDVLVLHLGQRRLVIVEPRLHQIDAGQELVGRHHAEQMLARHVHEARQARAGADENLPEAGVPSDPRGSPSCRRRNW